MHDVFERPSLLLGAFPPELAGLDLNPPPGWCVRCTGVGALTAGIATAGFLAALNPRQVLFVGTCGAYDDRLAIDDFVEASEALSISVEEADGRAYRPAIECVRWASTFKFPEPLGLPVHPVAVPMAVTKTVEGARSLGRSAAAEHLEITGVFAACHAAGTPCGAVLGVADHVGPEAHQQWKENNARVSRELIQWLVGKGVFLHPLVG